MSRYILLILTAALTFGLSSCAKTEKKEDKDKKNNNNTERFDRRW